jgi:hypothetical protein
MRRNPFWKKSLKFTVKIATQKKIYEIERENPQDFLENAPRPPATPLMYTEDTLPTGPERIFLQKVKYEIR